MDTEHTEMSISEARANLTELIASVRLLRRGVYLTRREKRQAAIVPAELWEAADAVGGPDEAVKLLRAASSA